MREFFQRLLVQYMDLTAIELDDTLCAKIFKNATDHLSHATQLGSQALVGNFDQWTILQQELCQAPIKFPKRHSLDQLHQVCHALAKETENVRTEFWRLLDHLQKHGAWNDNTSEIGFNAPARLI